MASERRRGLLLIGVMKLLKSLGLFVLGVGLLSLLHRDAAEAVKHWIEFLRIDAHARLTDELLAKIAGIDHRTLRKLGVGTLLYATVFGVEGVGLLLSKTWAEYMTTGVTTSFLPVEVYELSVHPSAIKAVVTIVNIAVVIYLVLEIRRKRGIERLRTETRPARASA